MFIYIFFRCVSMGYDIAGVPKLDPLEDMQIEEDLYNKIERRIENLESVLRKHKLVRKKSSSKREAAKASLNEYEQKIELEEKIKALKKELKASQTIVYKDELRARRRVLRRLGFLSEEDIVQVWC